MKTVIKELNDQQATVTLSINKMKAEILNLKNQITKLEEAISKEEDKLLEYVHVLKVLKDNK